MQNSTRERLIGLIIAATLCAITLWGYLTRSTQESPPESEMRMPAGKPLLEPDRPDLIGDPGIADEDEDRDEPIPDT